LLLDEYGLGHHGTRPARTREPGKGRQEVENQDGQVAHGIMLTSQRNRKKCEQIRDSPCTRGTAIRDVVDAIRKPLTGARRSPCR